MWKRILFAAGQQQTCTEAVPGLFEDQGRASLHDFPSTVTRPQPTSTSLGTFVKAKQTVTSHDTLWDALKDCWNNGDSLIMQKNDGVDARMQAVIKANRGDGNYSENLTVHEQSLTFGPHCVWHFLASFSNLHLNKQFESNHLKS